MPVERSADLAFLARAQLGDLVALDHVLAGIQAPLFKLLSIMLGDEDTAADV